MIEVTTFRLADGVDHDEFLAADTRVQNEFIPNHPGFVRRTTARSDDDEWIVITLWGSPEEADASAQLAAADPIVTAFDALIAGPSRVIRRFTELD